jgi:hypothetical protein
MATEQHLLRAAGVNAVNRLRDCKHLLCNDRITPRFEPWRDGHRDASHVAVIMALRIKSGSPGRQGMIAMPLGRKLRLTMPWRWTGCSRIRTRRPVFWPTSSSSGRRGRTLRHLVFRESFGRCRSVPASTPVAGPLGQAKPRQTPSQSAPAVGRRSARKALRMVRASHRRGRAPPVTRAWETCCGHS